jgi:arylformamidase
MLIDISPPIASTLAVYPGDVAFMKTTDTSIEAGDPATTSHFTTTSHLGAHVDAERHYVQGGRGVDEWPLDRFVGPCEVLRVEVGCGELILPTQVQETRTPRVLFRTGSYGDPETFTSDFAGIHPDTIDMLAARGCVLIGIDTPSVDRFGDTELPTHNRIAKHGMTILEGLQLTHVDPGEYELIALPLRIEGGDASPVRAVLRGPPDVTSD